MPECYGAKIYPGKSCSSSVDYIIWLNVNFGSSYSAYIQPRNVSILLFHAI